jgi:hypothetical protein
MREEPMRNHGDHTRTLPSIWQRTQAILRLRQGREHRGLQEDRNCNACLWRCLISVTQNSSQGAGLVSAKGAARVMALAATPTFVIMALLASYFDGQAGATLCSAVPQHAPVAGMPVMYWLMSVFHFPPWLKLIARRFLHLRLTP